MTFYLTTSKHRLLRQICFFFFNKKLWINDFIFHNYLGVNQNDVFLWRSHTMFTATRTKCLIKRLRKTRWQEDYNRVIYIYYTPVRFIQTNSAWFLPTHTHTHSYVYSPALENGPKSITHSGWGFLTTGE